MRLVKLSIHATSTALKINQMKADISWPTTTISVTGTGGKDWALVLLTRYTTRGQWPFRSAGNNGYESWFKSKSGHILK